MSFILCTLSLFLNCFKHKNSRKYYFKSITNLKLLNDTDLIELLNVTDPIPVRIQYPYWNAIISPSPDTATILNLVIIIHIPILFLSAYVHIQK